MISLAIPGHPRTVRVFRHEQRREARTGVEGEEARLHRPWEPVFSEPETMKGGAHMPELLTPDDVAAMFHTSPAQLAQWRHRGGGPQYVKTGKRVFYTRAAIESFLAQHTYQRTDQPVVA